MKAESKPKPYKVDNTMSAQSKRARMTNIGAERERERWMQQKQSL